MKIKTAISRIRAYKPVNLEGFVWAGVPLEKKPIGTGAFREVLQVKDCPLVVKFPLAEGLEDDDLPDFRSSVRHSALEMKKLERLTKFKWMRRFLPKVYYYDRKHGIIVMQFYEDFDYDSFYGCASAEFVRTLIRRSTGVMISDYGPDNVRRGKDDQLVLIDCGY